MGHYIDSEGRFQSERHPDLEPDKIVLSFKDYAARPALKRLALNYKRADPELSDDILHRLQTIRSVQKTPEAE